MQSHNENEFYDSEPNIEWANASISDVPRDQLRMQLEFYQESLILKGFDDQVSWVRRVSADEIAATLTHHMGARTGLLPQGALWWKQSSQGTITAIWREPQVWAASLQVKAFEAPERFQLPMPGLIFICPIGHAPWVFAAQGRPEDPEAKLYHAPTFNVFRNGRVCPGNHTFPERPEKVPESFFESHFSTTGDTQDRSTKHPNELYDLWKEINGQDEYPLDDLVQVSNIAGIMEIPDWQPRYYRTPN